MFWYTIGQIKRMYYGMSTGTVRWLVCEIVEKNNIKDKEL